MLTWKKYFINYLYH